MKVLLIVLLVLTAILSLKATVTVEYSDEVAVFLKLLFIKIKIVPSKKKNKGPHSMGRGKARKIREASVKKKKKKREAKAAKKQKKELQKAKPKKKKSLEEILDMIVMVKKLVVKVVKIFAGHLRIKVARIKIKVGAEDAASCAIAYGAITQGINLLFPVLEKVKNFSLPKCRDIDVTADFTSSAIEADVSLSFSLRVWHVFHVAFGALGSLIAHKLTSDVKSSGHQPPKNNNNNDNNNNNNSKKRENAPSREQKAK